MFTTVKKTRAGANVMKFQGPKRLQDPGTVARSLIDPETAEKTVPPCLAQLHMPDCIHLLNSKVYSVNLNLNKVIHTKYV